MVVAYPNSLQSEYAHWLSVAMGMDISEDIVKEAMERLKITHKHIKKIAIEQDPVRCVSVDCRVRSFACFILS